MAITTSAKKALRSSVRKRVFNMRRKEMMKGVVKEIKKLAEGRKAAEAIALLPKAYKAIDKAAKRGVIKANAASRKKSRLAHLLTRAARSGGNAKS